MLVVVGHIGFSLFQQTVPRVTAPGVQEQQDEGDQGDGHHGEEHQECNRLKLELREIEFFGELFIELAKCFKMVIILDEKGVKDDGTALKVEKEQRDPVYSCHPLWSFRGNRHRDEKGDENVDHLVVLGQAAEGFLNTVEYQPVDEDLDDGGHPEESRCVLEADHIDGNLGDEDEDEHEEDQEVAHCKLWPQTLPGPCVVFQQGQNHREEGDAHRNCNEGFEINTKAGETVVLDEPSKTAKEHTLNYKLSKRLCRCL